MIKNFRDLLAILLAVIIFPGMWVLAGLKVAAVPEGVLGATIAIETLIAQFYWRRATAAEEQGTEKKP